jgi:hypothetical protein
MEMNKKQAEFWGLIIGMMIAVALVILIIDYGIKTAILEESTRLRLIIEGEKRGQKPVSTDANGVGDDLLHNPALSSDVLVVDTSAMEAGNGHPRSQKSSPRARNRRSEPDGSPNDRAIQDGNE